MKHLKKFEYNTIFNTGDYVKCVEPPIHNEIEMNHAYIVDYITQDDKIMLMNHKYPFYKYRFVKISKDEYDMIKNMNNYNL
jgi:hypothetical protein